MRLFTAAAFLAVVSPLAACSVSVDEDHRGNTADVRILTPVGRVLVRTGGLPDTGLAAYPGSTRVRVHREAEAADVSVGNSAFGVRVAAVNFESDASPDAILTYYKNALRENRRWRHTSPERLKSMLPRHSVTDPCSRSAFL